MPDFEPIIKNIQEALRLIFGDKVPPWISPFVGWLLLGVIAIFVIWGLLELLSKIKDTWSRNILPLFYNQEQKYQSQHRRIFAEHIEYEIRKLNLKEDWKDYRFTELEAEVEAEGRRRIFSIIPFLALTMDSLRRERSLSKALASSAERLILLEGEPGSGKSVALRHVTEMMARRAKNMRSTKSVIPIYINLKELERPYGTLIDRNLIESFVLKSLKRINDRDVDKFLDDEFHTGIEKGTWLFLFDSFDELPDILSSTDSDSFVISYGNAIDDFLHGMNRCRGVIASRQFRGPTQFGWPRFRILSLSENRRLELVRRMDLTSELENTLIGNLGTQSQELRLMACNPLFLSLLCEHIKSGHSFPNNSHVVFESYIENRLNRDRERLQKRFKLNTAQVREAAEKIAFCMTADTSVGLNPTYKSLQDAFLRQGMKLVGNFDQYFDALEYIKLARSETSSEAVQSRSFSFSHRRFQEYFATCIVLREPSRISSKQLLTDARWRETAVVMCQTQPIQKLAPILKQIERNLKQFCNSIPSLIDTPLEFIYNKSREANIDHQQSADLTFSWPSGCLHLLSLLQEGFTSRIMDLPENIRLQVGKLVLSYSEMGTLGERKWALEVAGTAPELVLAYLLRGAFSSRSQWLKEVAYRQVARLSSITPDIAQGVRDSLIELTTSRRLLREKQATKAHLLRINHSKDFLSTLQLLLWTPRIDLWLHILLLVLIIQEVTYSGLSRLIFVLPLFVVLYISHLTFRILIPSQFLMRNYLGNYFSKIMIYFALRFTCLFLLNLYLLRWIHSDNASSIIQLIVIMYLIFFAPLAIWAAKTGNFNSPSWWIILPIWPLLYGIIKPRFTAILIASSFISASQRSQQRSTPVSNWLGLIFLLVILPMQFLLPWILSKNQQLEIKFISFLGIVMIILMILAIAFILGATAFIIYRLTHDWLRWHNWIKGHRSSMNYQELCEAASRYYYDSFNIRVIKFVREQNLLAPTSEAERFLQKVVIEIEMGQEKRKKVDVLRLRLKSFESSMPQNESECRIFASSRNPDVLDELYVLLENIRASRQTK